ncbi:hypothetical protein Ancab_000256 [Ancistrocladus abbreviatus]
MAKQENESIASALQKRCSAKLAVALPLFPGCPPLPTVMFPPGSSQLLNMPVAQHHPQSPTSPLSPSLSHNQKICCPKQTLCSPNKAQVPKSPTNSIKILKWASQFSCPPSSQNSHYRTHKVFLFTNYLLLGAASSCIFLTLSLRLLPSLCGFLLILLHLLTIVAAISGCAAASRGSNRWYGAHMVATVLTAVFQGSVSVLIFTRANDFLQQLKSYVREEDAVVILKLAGGLCGAMFCLEWVVVTLASLLKYYDCVDGGDNGMMKRSAKVQEEEMGNWPYPFKVQV